MSNITNYQEIVNQNHSITLLQLERLLGNRQRIITTAECGENGNCWWKCKSLPPSWTSMQRFLKTLLQLMYEAAVRLLGTYLTEMMQAYWRKQSISMFTAALFNITAKQKPTKSPSTEEWIKKTRYPHTVKFYSAGICIKSCHL